MASNNKRTLYVGGLADEVDVNILKSAFLPFGDIVDVNLPIDYAAQKHKGFAFIEYRMPEDAADAIDNMDNGEILGRTIRVNVAKPDRFRETSNRPIWSDDKYLQKHGSAPLDDDKKNIPETTAVDCPPQVVTQASDNDSD